MYSYVINGFISNVMVPPKRIMTIQKIKMPHGLVYCVSFKITSLTCILTQNNKELENINNSNTMAFTESLPDKEMVNETIKFSNVTGNVAMEELSLKTCCKYYSDEEYQKLPENNNMNIFHTNINGLLPATNLFASKENEKWKDVTFVEFINFLGLMYFMEVYRLPEQSMYWRTEADGAFLGMCFGKYMTRNRFEDIIKYLTLSFEENRDHQFNSFFDAVNKQFKQTIVPGDFICIDESMVKAYQRTLRAKKKIRRKPQPVGNEFHTICDGLSKIVLHMELYADSEENSHREYAAEMGVMTATTLRLSKHWKGTGRTVVADSWFGSVKACVNLKNVNGLYVIMIVKTAHKHFPREQLTSLKPLQRGEWASMLATFS